MCKACKYATHCPPHSQNDSQGSAKAMEGWHSRSNGSSTLSTLYTKTHGHPERDTHCPPPPPPHSQNNSQGSAKAMEGWAPPLVVTHRKESYLYTRQSGSKHRLAKRVKLMQSHASSSSSSSSSQSCSSRIKHTQETQCCFVKDNARLVSHARSPADVQLCPSGASAAHPPNHAGKHP